MFSRDNLFLIIDGHNEGLNSHLPHEDLPGDFEALRKDVDAQIHSLACMHNVSAAIVWGYPEAMKTKRYTYSSQQTVGLMMILHTSAGKGADAEIALLCQQALSPNTVVAVVTDDHALMQKVGVHADHFIKTDVFWAILNNP